MSEYYAVQRSSEYLAHYGVKGMKWGVKKAIEKGNAKRLSRQYAKAQKKLAKLNAKADLQKQQQIASKSNKIAKRAFGVGLAGIGTATGSKILSGRLLNKAAQSATQMSLWRKDAKRGLNHLATQRNDTIRKNWDLLKDPKNYKEFGINKDTAIERTASFNKDIVDHYYKKDVEKAKDFYNTQIKHHKSVRDRANTGGNVLNAAHKIVGGVGVAALGVAAGSKIRSGLAKHRTTAKGHAKAVAKRDAWKKEMNKAFAGTRYGAARNNPKRRKSK